jgi:hypothetical protein
MGCPACGYEQNAPMVGVVGAHNPHAHGYATMQGGAHDQGAGYFAQQAAQQRFVATVRAVVREELDREVS